MKHYHQHGCVASGSELETDMHHVLSSSDAVKDLLAPHVRSHSNLHCRSAGKSEKCEALLQWGHNGDSFVTSIG